MKELDLHDNQVKDRAIEVLQKKKQKQEYKLINKILPQKGHRVYEINEFTLEVVEASEVIHNTISWWDALRMIDNPNYLREIQVKQNHSYISALSPKSALDRYLKGKGNAVRATGKRSLKLW